jgi:hypothetical protein
MLIPLSTPSLGITSLQGDGPEMVGDLNGAFNSLSRDHGKNVIIAVVLPNGASSTFQLPLSGSHGAGKGEN